MKKYEIQYGAVNTNGWVMLWHDGLLCDVLERRMLGKKNKRQKKDTVNR